jgi:single-strand DNA-binding protein
MNKVVLIGRLTKDAETRYSGELAISRYALAIDRKGKDAGTDFINCVAFGKSGEFAEKYLRKGMKIAVTGRIQTGSYTDKETGKKVYTTDVVAEEHEFCESKQSAEDQNTAPAQKKTSDDGFMNIPDGIDEELPFN